MGDRHLKEITFATRTKYLFQENKTKHVIESNTPHDFGDEDEHLYNNNDECNDIPSDEENNSGSRDTFNKMIEFQVTYKKLYEEFSDIANIVLKCKKRSEAFFATLVNIKGILRNDPKFKYNVSNSFHEIIQQSRSHFINNATNNHNNIEIYGNDEIPYKTNRTGGRPVQRRLMSNIERKQIHAKKNEMRHRSCTFCHSTTHRITTCDERKRWGQKLSETNVDKFCVELCTTNSSVFPTHKGRHNRRKTFKVKEIPKKLSSFLFQRNTLSTPTF